MKKTNKCIYGYVDLLCCKQHSPLHASVTYCGHFQGGILEGLLQRTSKQFTNLKC